MPVRNVIIVCGHAVYTATDFAHPVADSSWFLLPYQKGEGSCYLDHVRRGVELAAADPDSLLVYTGGQTRAEAGPRSEAESYLRLARHFEFWGHTMVADRATAEEFARDSLENLLFGICRFYEVAHAWPERVTVVSWAFKRPRFDFHRDTIRFPPDRFVFDGPNDPRSVTTALAGEQQYVDAFRSDPYASGGILAQRRAARNPFHRNPPYPATCPAVAGLLQWHGPDPFPHSLPWDG